MKIWYDQRTTRKEFSNDPTASIAEIYDIFQKKMVTVQSDLQNLKAMLEDQNQVIVINYLVFWYIL